MIVGRASPDGTARRAANRPGYRRLGSTGLTVSVVGFGGYRTGRTDPTQRGALRAALAAGVNLVDTSSNYLLGESEQLVGEVLAETACPREEVVVVTKIGYVQGPNLELAQQREAEGRPFPELVKYAEGLWHCLHPEFLEDQLGRAQQRLQLETIDVLLLHNPEYFLSQAAHDAESPPLETIRERFYDRLERAFSYLNGAVKAGRIGAYGVSSNTCVVPAEQPDATSVSRMHQASGGRLEVLQLPYNLLESGALLERNTPDPAGGRPLTALEAAQGLDLGVLVNRPLNAAGPHGRLVRLADPSRPEEPSSEVALRARLTELAAQERTLTAAFGQPGLEIADLLESRWQAIGSPEGWAHFLRGELLPTAQRGLYGLLTRVNRRPSPEQSGALRTYQDLLNALIDRLQARLQLQDPRLAVSLRARLEPHLPLALRAESLSRLALDFVVSSPGVTCTLNGMRHPAYVADAVGVMHLPPIPDVAAVARAFSSP